MNYLCFIFKKAISAHLLVPLWKSREERRYLRKQVVAKLCEAYVSDLPVVVPKDAIPERLPKEYIFSIWLQGEDQAPRIVRSCWDSIRRHCTEELVILDAESICNWIDLPEDFLKRWRNSKIKPAHVADLCRVELLWKYGGYWMDATDYMCHPMPEFITQSQFFMYMGDDDDYSPFIQNCFIRAFAHHPLVGAWREVIRTYWERHSKACDYFLPHRLFRHIVTHNSELSKMFNEMPHVNHLCTHSVRWCGYWDSPFDQEMLSSMTSDGAFQKLEYKSESSRNPLPGSFADYFVHGKV